MYTYAWYHWITFFFIYCFCGWVFESTYVSLKEHKLVNRGFLRLPMLPLYGSGAIMMLWVSIPVKDNIILVYISGVLGATVLEYVTGYAMERLYKIKYWDYSHLKYNVHGYICLSSSLAWGFLTIFMTEIIHKPFERLVLSLPPAMEFTFIAIVGTMFMADTYHSTREALNLAKALEALTKLKADAEHMQVQLALLKTEITQRRDDLKDHTITRVSDFKNETEAALTTRIESLNKHLNALSERRTQLKQEMGFYRRGMLRGNPYATSKKFADALKEMRESLKK